jgi:hypothetical protein
MKERKINMGERGGRRSKATKVYLFICIYIYLLLIIYPNHAGYHIDYVITVFSFTIGFNLLRIFTLKLPYQLTYRL